jgi:hypothetical protein
LDRIQVLHPRMWVQSHFSLPKVQRWRSNLRVWILHPTDASVIHFFPLVGLSKPNMVIFSLFYKFDGQLKPVGMSAGAIFSPDYFDVDQIFSSPDLNLTHCHPYIRGKKGVIRMKLYVSLCVWPSGLCGVLARPRPMVGPIHICPTDTRKHENPL